VIFYAITGSERYDLLKLLSFYHNLTITGDHIPR
jgi:hypothetical protein